MGVDVHVTWYLQSSSSPSVPYIVAPYSGAAPPLPPPPALPASGSMVTSHTA